MPSERVLIEIVTSANLAGVKEAQAGLLGFNPVALAAGLALGGLVVAGKAAIAISREHFIAENNLANAIKNRGGKLQDAQTQLAEFMQVNRDFISNQNDVINAYADLAREGVKSAEISSLLTLAMNIQATEGGTLQDSVLKLQQAEVGRNRGLATQVGLVLKAIPAHATLAQKEAIVAYNIGQVTKAYGAQKPKLDPLTVATNHLKTDWELIAEKYGPELVSQVAAAAEAIDKSLPTWIDWGTKVYYVASQLGTLLDSLQLLPKIQGAIGNLNAPGGMPSDPNSPSIYAQQHKGQPNYGAAAHLRPHTTLHLHGPVQIVTPAAAAAKTSADLRRYNRSFS